MLATIRHGSTGKLVVAAKLLTGYVAVTSKVEDADSFIKLHGTYDADFVAHVCTWQRNLDLEPDGIIGPMTWTAIAGKALTCSTSRNRISGTTLALQMVIDSSITADAIYGPRTKAAVAAFQTAKGLDSDGICGPITWNALITGAGGGTFVKPTDFKQAAKPWGPMMYSNHGDPKQTMATSGCGPTSAADIIHFCRDNTIDPYDMAKLALGWGDRTYNSGTSWEFFTHLMTHYNYKKMIATKSVETLKACLDAGGYAVACMGPGYWTSGGHFITPWKYDATHVYCNDPASSSRTKQKWGDFQKQRKQFFCFFPNPEDIQTPEDGAGSGEVAVEIPAEVSATRGDKIADVARYQGKINWDLLAPELAFAVIKASGLYRNGADTQYANNVRGAVSHGVPWHAYSFLYCKTDAEVKRDARLFFETVYDQGHWPLFWVMDMEAEWGAKDRDVPKLAEAFEAELRYLARTNGPGEIRVAAYVAQQKYDDWALDYDHYAYLWIPGYGEKFKPTMPCDIWQYTAHGKLPGINGDVDLNVLMGRKPIEFFVGR